MKLARFYSSNVFYVVMVLTSFYSPIVEAATRAILIPGRTAILIMEGVSSAGIDPDVRRLYCAVSMTPVQQAGGEGKVMQTATKDFSLACATKNSSPDSIVCNITVQAGVRSKVGSGVAEIQVEGADAALLNEKLAGSGKHFEFESTDHRMQIESTLERFDFRFQQ